MNSRYVPKPEVVERAGHHASLILEASAGTGKTFAIEHLVADMVLNGTPLERILVITFTEKAAAELKGRLSTLFAELPERETVPEPGGWRLDAVARERLARARRILPRAFVSTIHSFCLRVLRELPMESGGPFELDVIPSRAAFDEGFRSFLRRDLPNDDTASDYVTTWMRHRRLDRLMDLMMDVVELQAEPQPNFQPEAWSAAVAGLGRHDLRSWVRRAQRHSRRLRNHVALMARHLNPEASPASQLAALDRAQVDLKTVLRELSPALASPEREALEQLSEAQVPFDAAVACVLLPGVESSIERTCADRGWQTYADMVNRLDAASPEVYRQLRSRFDAALVDEFQDTDPRQWNIVRRLWEGSAMRLVLVGDPKQSIYGFRGADSGAFRNAQLTLERSGARTLSLDANHRSTPQLVEAFNLLFPDVFTGQNVYRPVRSARPDRAGLTRAGRPVAPVHLLRFPPETLAGSVVQVRRGWSRAIADLIVQHLDGRTSVHDGHPLRPSDIFVLTRTTREGRQVAQILRSAHIPVHLFERDGVLQGPEARAALAVLEALAQDDPRRNVHAWLTAMFGLEPHQLREVTDLPLGHPFLESLRTWRRMMQAGQWVSLFSAWMTAARARMQRAPDRWGQVEILQQVLDELLERTRSQSPDEVVEWLRRSVEGKEGAPMPRQEEGVDAVRVSTIHGAKGLESEVMVLFGGLKPASSKVVPFRSDTALKLHVGRDPPALALSQASEEEERLLYVALTRARAHVVLPSFEVAFDGFVRHLGRALDRLPEHLHTTTRVEPSKLRVRTTPARPAPAAGRPRPPILVDGWSRSGPVTTSFTHLKQRTASDATIPREGPSEPSPEDITREPPAGGLPGGPRTGQCVHRLLETAPLGLWNDIEPEVLLDHPVLAPWLYETMDRYGMPRSYGRALAALLHRTLTRPLPMDGGPSLDQLPDTAFAREMDFTLHLPEAGGALVRGFLDGVVEHRGSLTILDYKTDVRASYAPDSLHRYLEDRYGLQSDLYLAALGAARLRTPVAGTLFFFVRSEPPDGYVFRAADGGERRRVAEAVREGLFARGEDS
ncbi:MAG: UvrD-helicase domain-containing protein [Myxococcota bacterium]